MSAVDYIIKAASFVGAVAAICGAVYAAVMWFHKQGMQSSDIESLKKLHISDMEKASEKEAKDMQEIKDELCVLSYAVLATLDGLKQLHCNGEVTKAHEKLEKHLNQKAHGQ